MSEFLMPSLGADMDAGTLLEWYIKPGDKVHKGDVIALVDTDKAAIEIEVFEAGVIGELFIDEGKKVPVGTPLALIQPEGAGISQETPLPIAKEAPGFVVPEAISTQGLPQLTTEAPHVSTLMLEEAKPKPATYRATPAARKHALELGIDLNTLKGTGKHGVINKADVDAAVIAKEPVVRLAETKRQRVSPLARRLAKELELDLQAISPGKNGVIRKADVLRQADRVPAAQSVAMPAEKAKLEPKAEEKDARFAGMRRAIAAALGKSKREIPHYYLSQPIDMSKALNWLTEENLKRPINDRIVPATLLLKATALAAKEVPELNGFWQEEGFKASSAVHLGVGISLRQGGLIAPCIHDVDQKNLGTLMLNLRDLVKRARNLQLKSSEMTDATITVTNLGDQGVELVYGIIYPPQVALVGFGKVIEQPWAENGMLGVKPIVQATLAADHRASDGHIGGLFLMAIDKYLQTPEAL